MLHIAERSLSGSHLAMIPGTMISTSRLNGILFVTALSLLLITVLSHFFGPSSETLSDFKDYGSDLASKVMPAFSGAGLGSVKDHVSRSERQYQETLAGRQWLGTQWEDPDNKTLYVCEIQFRGKSTLTPGS